MARTKATDALLTDHKLINKILDQFTVDNPRFPHLALTLHRAVLAHAWFEDEVFLPATEGEPRFFKKFTEEIFREHQDIDALLKLVRKTPLAKREELDDYVLQLKTLLSTHFHKEEDALFPVAERVLSNEGLLELGDEMKRRQTEVRKFIAI